MMRWIAYEKADGEYDVNIKTAAEDPEGNAVINAGSAFADGWLMWYGTECGGVYGVGYQPAG